MKESISKRDAETQQLEQSQQTTMVFNWEKLVREMVMKHPREIKGLLADIDPEVQTALFEIISQKYPGYDNIIKLLLRNNGNASGNALQPRGKDVDQGNVLDDNDPEKSYDIPDTEILDEIRQFACSLHLGGYGWAAISDQIFAKYDVDWNPLKVKDVVLKSLAWNHRNAVQPTLTSGSGSGSGSEATKTVPEPYRGLVRKFFHRIW